MPDFIGASDPDADDEPVCRICDTPLAGEPDDDPDDPLGPLCADCVQARLSEEDAWMEDL